MTFVDYNCSDCMYNICFIVNVKSLGYVLISNRIIKFLIGRMLCRLGGGSACCFLIMLFILSNAYNNYWFYITFRDIVDHLEPQREMNWNYVEIPIEVLSRPGGVSASRLSLQLYTTIMNTNIIYTKFSIKCACCVDRASVHIPLLIIFIQFYFDNLI